MLDQSSDSLPHSKSGAPAIMSSTAASPEIARWSNGERTYRSVVTLLRNVQPGKLPQQRRTKQTLCFDQHNFQKIIIEFAHARKYPGPVTL
jgi:hypothetical protein